MFLTLGLPRGIRFAASARAVSRRAAVPSAVIILLFVLCPLSLEAAQVTLGWDANSEPDLEGYVVHRNADYPGPPYDYSDSLPEYELVDPLHPKLTLTDLNEGREYYVALTAYNTEGVESSFSNDICVEVVDGVVELCSQSTASGASTSSSSGGGDSNSGCFITTAGAQASAFSQWVAGPVIRSQVATLLFLLVVLIAAVKLRLEKTHPD